MKSPIQRHCPDSKRLEMLLLDVDPRDAERKRLQLHLQQCSKCRQESKEIDAFYNILVKEMQRPVSNRLLDFSQKLCNNKTLVALFDCEPLDEKPNGHGKGYHVKLLHLSSQDPAKSMTQFDLNALPKDHIILRLVIDPDCQTTVCYLWNAVLEEYENWTIDLPFGDDPFLVATNGAVKIPYLFHDRLDDKNVYFNFRQKSLQETTRFEKILESIV